MALALAASAWAGVQPRTGLGWVPDLLLGLVAGGLGAPGPGRPGPAPRLALGSWPWRFCFGALGAFAALGGAPAGPGRAAGLRALVAAAAGPPGGEPGRRPVGLCSPAGPAWRLLAAAVTVDPAERGPRVPPGALAGGPGLRSQPPGAPRPPDRGGTQGAGPRRPRPVEDRHLGLRQRRRQAPAEFGPGSPNGPRPWTPPASSPTSRASPPRCGNGPGASARRPSP